MTWQTAREYAKGIIAVVGSTAIAALALIPSGSTLWTVLAIVAAFATALGVIRVPNAPKQARHTTAPKQKAK